MWTKPLWTQQQSAKTDRRQMSLYLSPRDDWISTKLSSRVCGQLWLFSTACLYQQKVSRSLSRTLWSQCLLQSKESCSNLCLQSRIYRRSLLQLLQTNHNITKTSGSLQTFTMWNQCRVSREKWSSLMYLSPRTIWRSLHWVQARVYRQLWMSCRQGLCQTEVCRSLSWSLWDQCSVQSSEPYSYLHLSPGIYWRPSHCMQIETNK